MHRYIPATDNTVSSMLSDIGKPTLDSLFDIIPRDLRLSGDLNLAQGLSEPEILARGEFLAGKNKDCKELMCFLGAGAYDTYIPSTVKHLISRSEFYTAYTPYQAEISQGTLQAIFEFQTMIAEITGMDVANASMYDGGSACAEAALMAAKQTRRKTIIISKTVQPEVCQVVRTYARFNDISLVYAEMNEGVTDMESLVSQLSDDVAGVILQSPNFFGRIEDLKAVCEAVHENKALLISYVSNPHALAVIERPGALGADIVCGEGQSLGIGLHFGGPYLGFMAASEKLMRKLPGRIVGETTDTSGKRAFVLTLQTREQHIRREKATSNICTNQGLNALAATIYMSVMGPNGMREVAIRSMKNARYLKQRLVEADFEILFDGPFYNEFLVKLKHDTDDINKKLLSRGILGGYCMPEDVLGQGHTMLLCTTEKRTRGEIEALVDALREEDGHENV